MAGVSSSGERTFVRLWTYCDDEGRCLGNPRLVGAAIYPLHDEMDVTAVESDLKELENAGLICRYQGPDDRAYISISSWDEYQHPQRPTASRYPQPPGDVREPSANGHGALQDASLLEVGEGEGEGEGEGDGVGGGVRGGTPAGKRRATKIPDPFLVTDAMRSWLQLKLPAVDYRTETEKFLDHHRAKGSTMLDWTAAWRLWMRNSVKYAR